jgi:hypothetical protein
MTDRGQVCYGCEGAWVDFYLEMFRDSTTAVQRQEEDSLQGPEAPFHQRHSLEWCIQEMEEISDTLLFCNIMGVK